MPSETHHKHIYRESDLDVASMITGDHYIDNAGNVFFKSGFALIKLPTSKGDIGLGQIDNTSDADKPVSTLVAQALALRAPIVHTHNDLYALISHTHSDYAPLVAGKIPVEYLPNDVFAVWKGDAVDQTAMLALRGEPGDWCLRSDLPAIGFIIANNGASLSDWKLVNLGGVSNVTMVNGKTGVVTLIPDDIGAVDKNGLPISKLGTTYTPVSGDTGKNYLINQNMVLASCTAGTQIAVFNTSSQQVLFSLSGVTTLGNVTTVIASNSWAYFLWNTSTQVIVGGSPTSIATNDITVTAEILNVADSNVFNMDLTGVERVKLMSLGDLVTTGGGFENLVIQFYVNGAWVTSGCKGIYHIDVVNGDYTSFNSGASGSNLNNTEGIPVGAVGNPGKTSFTVDLTLSSTRVSAEISFRSDFNAGIYRYTGHSDLDVASKPTKMRIMPVAGAISGRVMAKIEGLERTETTEIVAMSGGSTEFETDLTYAEELILKTIDELTGTAPASLILIQFKVNGVWETAGYKAFGYYSSANSSGQSASNPVGSYYPTYAGLQAGWTTNINQYFKLDVILDNTKVIGTHETISQNVGASFYKEEYAVVLDFAAKPTAVRLYCAGGTMNACRVRLTVK